MSTSFLHVVSLVRDSQVRETEIRGGWVAAARIGGGMGSGGEGFMSGLAIQRVNYYMF